MWCGVLSLFRRGRGRRRRTARVVDESALGVAHAGAADGDDARGDGDVGAAAGWPGALARALLLAMACAVRLDGEHPGGGADEAWATSGWRPPRADEVSHLVARESMRYAIYA
ncbi:hypothetical protein GUJ93_ZPchr0014g46752 [Zizania palustris]|uniref:Uncharacterized protein n=1 Tax=Zizania palustris TaxID=103762 RepID=A0A8J5W6T6_ZIZPA|nr:hypothetical protein GUJ93_ZPchr0014g46752 [Zizania palustris]